MMRMIAAASMLTLLACGQQKEPPAEAATEPTRSTETAGVEGRDAIGRIYHYVRSNQDGTEAEDVYVFRKARDFIEVYKARDKCENAALVTAELDMEKLYATKIAGGRLLPNAQHEEFAFLTYDQATKQATIEVRLPGAEPVQASVDVEHEPFHDYDFDFASLTVMTPHLEPKSDFSFGLTLLITDFSRPDFFQYLGRADLTFRREEEREGRPAHRYIVGGPAFGSFGGSLWLDAEDGYILDVETGIPNHREYANFKLKLEDIDDGGAAAWRDLLTAHFEGCEEEAD